MKRPIVVIVPEYPLSLMTGGTLVQARETRRAMSQYVSEMQFNLFNWSDEDTPADCYHFIGLPKYLAGVCTLIAQADRPYVLTLLLGSEKQGGLRAAAWRRRAANWIGTSTEHQNAIERAAALITITDTDAEAASVIYGIARERIHQVRVAVSEPYFNAKPDLWVNQYGLEPFVLSVGAVQKRKNQLLLARTCNTLHLPLALVGGVLHGEDAYADQVRAAMTENITWGGRWFRCDDALLASAYAACRAYVQLSAAETQPASVLQAMALRKPVLLADAPYAREQPFLDLTRVDWRNEHAVKTALQKIWTEARQSSLPEEFTWPRVCEGLASIYRSVLA